MKESVAIRVVARASVRIVMVVGVSFASVVSADAMTFTWRENGTVYASGTIEQGDAAKFIALPKFNTLQLNSPGGLVSEALAIVANMDARGGIRTEVKPGESCASACAMALFVSGDTRIVRIGGRLGIHSCYKSSGIQLPECNKAMAANAAAHGVPWGVIEGFGQFTSPANMLWLSAEDAECWGLMKWNAEDNSNHGIGCFKQAMSMRPAEVSAKNADAVLCRMNAGSSRSFLSTGDKDQGFSDAYRAACRRVVVDPKTPKYAAIDILMWLVLTDPNILELKPGTLMASILGRDEEQIRNCWKCLTIAAMSMLMHGAPNDALPMFQEAVEVATRDGGSAPKWLFSRLDLAKAELAKKNR